VKEYRKILSNVLYVSRLTKVKRKKIRILLSAIISNSIGLVDILIILTFSTILTGTNIVENYFLQIVIDNPVLLVFIVIFRYGINFLGKYNLYSLTKDIEQSLKVYLLKDIYKKGNYSLADANYYIETLSGHIAYFFNAFGNILSSTIQILVFSIYLTFSDVKIVLLFGVVLLFLYFPSKILLKNGRIAMENLYEYMQYSARYIQRIIDNIYLVKILNTDKIEVENFNSNLSKLYNSEKRRFILQDLNGTIPNFIAIFSFTLILLISIPGVVITLEFIGIIIRLMQSVGTLNSGLSMLFATHVHLEKLIEVESPYENDSKYVLDNSKDSIYAITAKSIYFKYLNSNENFYENINLNFVKNKHYVITGVNGSGKSTLLGILAGALFPYSGNLTRFTDQFGYVGANPLILEDTLRENLKYGSKNEIVDDSMVSLLEEFSVFVKNDKQMLNSVISNKTLSSGQMQKISFIRALLSNCEVLFLDESTANLDTSSKKQISNILKSKRLTIINSTHNPEDFYFDDHLEIKVTENDKRIISKK